MIDHRIEASEDLLTDADVARLLGMTQDEVHVLVESGALRSFNFVGIDLYPLSDVQKLFVARKRPPAVATGADA